MSTFCYDLHIWSWFCWLNKKNHILIEKILLWIKLITLICCAEHIKQINQNFKITSIIFYWIFLSIFLSIFLDIFLDILSDILTHHKDYIICQDMLTWHCWFIIFEHLLIKFMFNSAKNIIIAFQSAVLKLKMHLLIHQLIESNKINVKHRSEDDFM